MKSTFLSKIKQARNWIGNAETLEAIKTIYDDIEMMEKLPEDEKKELTVILADYRMKEERERLGIQKTEEGSRLYSEINNRFLSFLSNLERLYPVIKAKEREEIEATKEKDLYDILNIEKDHPERIYLRRTREIVPLEDYAEEASEVYVIAPNGRNFIMGSLTFLKGRLSDNSKDFKFNILLLDPRPDKGLTEMWDQINDYGSTKSRIGKSICRLLQIAEPVSRGRCELRLSQVILPYAAVYVEFPEKEEAILSIEFFSYKYTTSTKHHIVLSKKYNKPIFEKYYAEIRKMWTEFEKNQVDLKDKGIISQLELDPCT